MFKDFQKLKLITTKFTACPVEFSLADRRVYSFLAYRARLNRTCSEREIAKHAFVDARTVKRRLNILAKHELVVRAKNRWGAKEPGEVCECWFPKNKQAKDVKHWFDSYCYSLLLLPKRGAKIKAGERNKFTIIHSHVYSMLASLRDRSTGIVSNCDTSRLVRLLNGIDPKTIRSAMAVLRSLGLIKTWKHNGHQAIHPLRIETRHSHLFQAVNSEENDSQTEANKEPMEEFSFKHSKHQTMFDECTANRIPSDLAIKIVQASAILALEADNFSGFLSVASREHDLNRFKGKVHVPHPGHLLLHKLNEAAGVMDREHKAMLAQASPANNVQRSQADLKFENVYSETAEELTAGYRSKIKGELTRTREFLVSQFGHLPTSTEIDDAIQNRQLKRWFVFGKIHPLFVVLCPEIRNTMSVNDIVEHFGSAVSNHLRPFSGSVEIYQNVFASKAENDCEQFEMPEAQCGTSTPPDGFDEFVQGLTTDDSPAGPEPADEHPECNNGWEIQHERPIHTSND